MRIQRLIENCVERMAVFKQDTRDVLGKPVIEACDAEMADLAEIAIEARNLSQRAKGIEVVEGQQVEITHSAATFVVGDRPGLVALGVEKRAGEEPIFAVLDVEGARKAIVKIQNAIRRATAGQG